MSNSESLPRIEQRDDFLESLKSRLTATWVGLGVTMSIVSFVLSSKLSDDMVTRATIAGVILSLGIVFAYVTALRVSADEWYETVDELRDKVEELKEEIEELNEYNAFLDAKYTTPVKLREKELGFELTEDGKDTLKYSYRITPEGDVTVDKFYALVGLDDPNITWDDIKQDVTVEGAKVDEYKRRDYGEWVRFIIELQLYRQVSPDEEYSFSLEVETDIFSLTNDFANPLVRHETDTIGTYIRLPEGWEFDGAIPKVDDDTGSTHSSLPEVEFEDNYAEWSCHRCEIGHSYEIEFWASESDRPVPESHERDRVEATDAMSAAP